MFVVWQQRVTSMLSLWVAGSVKFYLIFVKKQIFMFVVCGQKLTKHLYDKKILKESRAI